MKRNMTNSFAQSPAQFHLLTIAAAGLLLAAAAIPALADEDSAPQQILPNPVINVSTVPKNGDVNPYGVAFVPNGYPSGFVKPGDIFVSNYNNSQNLQGTGTTIVRFDSKGQRSLFFQGRQGIGLSTALNVSQEGPIFAGNSPTKDGSCSTAQPGSIFVLSPTRHLFSVLTDSRYINAPWDSTLYDKNGSAKLFIANALTGTISRVDLKILTTM